MARCLRCGKEFTGRKSKIYCGGTCKTGAYRSRKDQTKETKRNKLSDATLEDLKFIRQYSETAYQKLMELRALHGRYAFENAIDLTYAAVKDTAHSFFSS